MRFPENGRDRIFLVPDDPGNEDPQAICEGDRRVYSKGGCIATDPHGPQAAIQEAILEAVPGEVIPDPWERRGRDDARQNRNVPYRSRCNLCKKALAEYGNAFAEAATARETEE